MFLIARRLAAIVSRNSRPGLILRPVSSRLASASSKSTSRGGLASHLLAGALGGSVVKAAGYTWYYFSPIRQLVETSKRTKLYVQEARQSLSKHLPTQTVDYLRKISKAYVAVIPGAEIFVDSAFVSLNEIVEANSEEANAIATKAFEEIRRIVDSKKESLQAALEIMTVLKQRLGELQALGTKAREDALAPLLKKISGAKEKLADGFRRTLARRLGPEGKKAVDDATKQVKTILSDSQDDSRETVKRASSQVIKEKTASLRSSPYAQDPEHDHESSDG